MMDLTAASVLDLVNESNPPTAEILLAGSPNEPARAVPLSKKHEETILKLRARNAAKSLQKQQHLIKCAACHKSGGTLMKVVDGDGEELYDDELRKLYRHKTCRIQVSKLEDGSYEGKAIA